MRLKRVLPWLVLLVVGGGVGACFMNAAPPAPESGADPMVRAPSVPLQVSPRASPDAERKDAPRLATSAAASPADRNEAASEAFVLARDCVFAQRETKSIDTQLGICEQSEPHRNDPAQAPYFAFCDARVALFEKRLHALGAELASCESPDLETAELAFFERTREAARLGDADAQLCYARAAFTLPRRWTEAERAAHTRESADYLAAALRRGDWRFIELMRSRSHRSLEHDSLLSLSSVADPLTRYRYNRLLALGADASRYRRLLDAAIGTDPLSPQEKRWAEQWAQRTYNLHFARSPRLESYPDTCLGAKDDVNMTWQKRPL